MNDNSMHPIAVLFLIALAIVMLPVALACLIVYGTYKAIQWSNKCDAENREAAAITALPSSSRKPVGTNGSAFELAPDCQEIFTTAPTQRGRVYRVRMEGTCVITERSTRKDYSTHKETNIDTEVTIDALYRENHAGNFTEEHFEAKGHRREGVFIDGHPLAAIPHEFTFTDRDKHVYEIIFDGTGNKIAFAFQSRAMLYDGRLAITLSECPESIPTLATRAALEAQWKDAQNLAEAVEAMSTLTGLDRNWSDPAFVEAFARGRSGQILARREELQRRLVELHDNRRLMAHLRDQHPELLARLTGPIDAFVTAQRLTVERDKELATARPPQPRLRPSPDEVRERIVRRLAVAGDDELAVLQTSGEAWEKKNLFLQSLGWDEDVIVNAIGEKNEAISTALAELAERKEAKNGTKTISLA